MKNESIRSLKKLVNTLLFSWGSDAPPEALWSFNALSEFLKVSFGVDISIDVDDEERIITPQGDIEAQVEAVNRIKNASQLKSRMSTLLDHLESLVEGMPDKGLKCFNSQKVCLEQTLYEVEKNINGIEGEDLRP